ncbi:hypothetical protein C8R43DRAFT_955857 [Mycena crocata]|nr:hypothetical protein C8R43DRAFT_955857 [Mycena crocata]
MYALVHQWLTSVGAALMAAFTLLRHTITQTAHTVATAVSVLFSFESLVIAAFLSFAVLGSALIVFILWPIIAEQDDYDDCERGFYYADKDGRCVGMAIPVIVVERNRAMKKESELQTTKGPNRSSGEQRKH